MQKIDLINDELEIRLEGIGKKYSGRWIFRNISAVFKSGNRVAVTGPNGSGKSTLLQLISGFVSPSEGRIHHRLNDSPVNEPSKGVLAAPYLDLPEELTLIELIDFYFSFKKQRIPVVDCLKECNLHDFLHQPIKGFSSGMKQKVKLSLVFASVAGIYIFDEPCSHLDASAINWYQKNFSLLPPRSVVFTGSNSVNAEIRDCNQTISLG